jgi:predicted exporter
MNAKLASVTAQAQDFPNGAGAAALLAAGIGSFMVASFAILADKSAAIKSLMIFYKPTGPLSGVTTCGVLVWLISWAILDRRWRRRMVSLGPICTAALILLGLSLLLTFPPIGDLF